MLTPFKDLLAHALENHYAIGYFEAWDIYSLEAVLEAAEGARLPVILGFGGAMIEPGWLDNGGIERALREPPQGGHGAGILVQRRGAPFPISRRVQLGHELVSGGLAIAFLKTGLVG